MSVISRGIKNAFRNTIRTISITFILGLSIAMALIMLLAFKTVQSKISSVKSSMGNTITVTPAGVRGFEGGGELLTEQDASNLSLISHVSSVIKTLTDRLVSTDSSLVSPIEPGTFGNRQQGRMNSQEIQSDRMAVPRDIKTPVTVMATSDLESLASLAVNQFNVTSGEKFDINSTDYLALLGSELALKNNLSVGGTFQAYGKDIKVVGIYDTGNKYTNASLIMPMKTLQTLSEQADQINSIILNVDSVDSLSGVQNKIKEEFGNKVDVVSSEESVKNAITPLENISSISFYSLIGSLMAGAIIIFLTMIMIVRERRREIGVLKAIGSSNGNVMVQFAVESLVLTQISSVIGVILGVIFSNPVLKVLVNNSQTTVSATKETVRAFGPGGPGGMGGRAIERMSGGIADAQNTLNNIHAMVGWDIILYGILVAVAIAIIGSAIPSFIIAKVRPAEVMRQE